MELNYFTGTSGLILPVPNKLHYPPEFVDKSRLNYYASLMNSIEINSSFYKIPQAATVKRWGKDVPDDFKFTFKLAKQITHNKGLAFDPDDVSHFFNVIAEVNDKKGCVLLQLPPSVRIGHFAQLKFLMSVLRDSDPQMAWNIAVEFRHPSLYIEEVFELLENYQLGMVIQDKQPGSSPLRETHPDFVYLRFHVPGGNYRGSYSHDVLSEYSSYIAEWLTVGKHVYVYFNNTMGDALGNLRTLRSYLL